jgi:magnesium transporter
MPRFLKMHSKSAGLPPGTLVHIGERKLEVPRIAVIEYDEELLEEKELSVDSLEECRAYLASPTTTWINVRGVHQTEVLEELGGCLGLHPLVLEDVVNTDQRPKLEDYGDYTFVVLKSFARPSDGDRLEVEQISLVIARSFVISFQEGVGTVLDPIRQRIRASRGRIRGLGAEYLAYALLDAVVDSYFTVLEGIGDQVETIEEELVSDPKPDTLQTIHALKRTLIILRKSIWPLRTVIGALERSDPGPVGESVRVYLRDLYDHTIQIIDTVETFRDMISGMLDIYLSSVSNRMNEVMKVLTIIATIFIPLTLVAGIYGMNFRYMPELAWRWGYPLVWAVMLAITAGMLLYFRSKRWL